MATFTEVLPATQTHANRAMTWEPAGNGCGVLAITDTKTHTRYGVCRRPIGKGFAGVAFKLTKADGEVYCVRVGDAAEDVSCDCKGFAFGRGKPCKHVAAVRGMIENGWLPALPDTREAAWERIDRMFAAAAKEEAKRNDAKERKRAKFLADQAAYSARLKAMGKLQ
jgi:hypothetical protein